MDRRQQLNLKWNSFANNIVQTSSEFLSLGMLVDVTLSCQGRYLRAHKIILSACSAYFKDVFVNHVHKHPLIILKGIKFEELEMIVNFMYNGEINVHGSALDDFLAAAEMLQVKGLTDVRSRYERGDITSITPLLEPTPLQSTGSAGTPRKESHPHIAEATVNAFVPPGTITHAPHTVGTDQPLAIPAPTFGNRAHSTNAMTAIPAPAFRPADIGSQAAGSAAPSLTIANPFPINTLFPLPQFSNSFGGTGPGATIPPTITSATSAIPNYATFGGSLISNTSTTPSLDRPNYACVPGNFVNLNGNETFGKNFMMPTPNFQPIAELHRLPLMSIAPAGSAPVINATAIKDKKCTADTQPPRERKRRKIAHVVNELTEEVVLVNNDKVLRESNDVVSNNRMGTSQSPATPRTEGLEDSAEMKKTTGKRRSKNSQEPLPTKEKSNDTIIVTRPPTAFRIFAKERRPIVIAEFPNENCLNISAKLGVWWKKLNTEEKEIYYKMAQKADKEHRLKYPELYINPYNRRSRRSRKSEPAKGVPASSETRDEKTSSESQNNKENEVAKTHVKGDDREVIEFSDSSESADHDDDFSHKTPKKRNTTATTT